jgi:hypothetical protein
MLDVRYGDDDLDGPLLVEAPLTSSTWTPAATFVEDSADDFGASSSSRDVNGDGVSDWTFSYDTPIDGDLYGKKVVAVALGPFEGELRPDDLTVLELEVSNASSAGARVDDVDGNGVMDFLIAHHDGTVLYMNPPLHAPGAR